MPRPNPSTDDTAQADRPHGDARGARGVPVRDAGSAALEFILAGVVMLVPLVYLVVALGLIQEHSLGATTSARQMARVAATAPDAPTARERVNTLAATLLDDYGIDPSHTTVTLTCRPAASECPTPGAVVTVTVTAQLALPLVPPVFGLDQRARIPVEASSAQRVSRLWGAAP